MSLDTELRSLLSGRAAVEKRYLRMGRESRSRTPFDVNDRAVAWLLASRQPSVRYYAFAELLGRSPRDPDVQQAREELPKVGWADELFRGQKAGGYWEAHEPRTAGEWFRFLRFPTFQTSLWRGLVLADLGLTAADPRVGRFAQQVFDKMLPLSSPVNIYTEEVCVVGNTARMLTRYGFGTDRRVRRLHDWMLEDQREDGGWNCAPDRPGTLDAWEALAAFSAIPPKSRSPAIDRGIERGAEFFLERQLCQEGRRYPPWFRFHYPIHYYYDLLVGLDLLTELGYGGDRRLRPAIDLLLRRRRKDGTWTLDRIHPDEPTRETRWKVRPLALETQGQPSEWITLTALRVLRRVALAS